jgi:hypothetical protein
MRPHGQTKLGFFPLPVAEAKRLKTWLAFPERFSALDPCVGDGVAFAHLLREVTAHRYKHPCKGRFRRCSGPQKLPVIHRLAGQIASDFLLWELVSAFVRLNV